MKVAITGGTGFAGGHLAKQLLAEGHNVAVVSRPANPRAEAMNGSPRITRASCDLSAKNILAAAFAGCKAIAHCAGINRGLDNQT